MNNIFNNISLTGFLGIGVATPTARLHVAGSGVTSATYSLKLQNSSSVNIIKIHDSGQIEAGNGTDNNLFIGWSSGLNITSGQNNIALGSGSLSGVTTGDSNVAIGRALGNTTTGYENTAVGVSTLGSNTIGIKNTAIGRSCLGSNVDGSNNFAGGYSALGSNVSGGLNIGIGYTTLYLATGTGNLGIGYEAGYHSTGNYNIFLGYDAANRGNYSGKLFIDNQDRGSGAAEITNALIYGTFDVAPTSQILRINASVGLQTSPSSSSGFGPTLHIYGANPALVLESTNNVTAKWEFAADTTTPTNSFITIMKGATRYFSIKGNGTEEGWVAFGGAITPIGAISTTLASSLASGAWIGGTGTGIRMFGSNSAGGTSTITADYFASPGDLTIGTYAHQSNQIYLKSDGFVGINNSNPSATIHAIGSGSTSATYGLKIHNSTGSNNALMVRDDGGIGISSTPFDTSTRLSIKSIGTDNLSYAMKVESSASDPLLHVRDDGYVRMKRDGAVLEITPRTSTLSHWIDFIGGGNSRLIVGNNGTDQNILSTATVHASVFHTLTNTDMFFGINSATRLKIGGTDGTFKIVSNNAGGGSPKLFEFILASQLGLTAGTEGGNVKWDLAGDIQHATGAITTQRSFYIDPSNYTFVGASTITNAATFAISGPPSAGTNATITNALSLWVQSGKASFAGDVGIGTISPSARVHIKGSGNDNSTNSLKVENSSSSELLTVRDDGTASLTGKLTYGGSGEVIGKAVLVGGTVTVTTVNTINDQSTHIFITKTWTSTGTLVPTGSLYISARTLNSFTITSTNAADTSDVSWMIFEEPS